MNTTETRKWVREKAEEWRLLYTHFQCSVNVWLPYHLLDNMYWQDTHEMWDEDQKKKLLRPLFFIDIQCCRGSCLGFGPSFIVVALQTVSITRPNVENWGVRWNYCGESDDTEMKGLMWNLLFPIYLLELNEYDFILKSFEVIFKPNKTMRGPLLAENREWCRDSFYFTILKVTDCWVEFEWDLLEKLTSNWKENQQWPSSGEVLASRESVIVISNRIILCSVLTIMSR